MDQSATRPRLALLLVLVWTVGLYASVWTASFAYEDAAWMATVDMGGPTNFPLPGRSLTAQTYTWQAAITGLDPRWMHAGNLALHLLNGGMVYAIGAGLIGPAAGVLGAGIFLIHPLNSQAVSYLTARTDLLMTTWVLLAVWAALSLTWARALVAVGALVAAAMSKELGMVGVLLVLLTLIIWRPTTRWQAPALIPVWIVCGLALGVLYPRLEAWWTMAPLSGGSDWLTFLTLQTTACWRLLLLVVWPVGFTLDHDMVVLADRWRAVAVLMTGFALSLIPIAWDKQARMLTWALAWIALGLAPRFLVPTTELVSEHHLYLPMVGISLGIGTAALGIWRWVTADADYWRLCRAEWRAHDLTQGA